MMSGLRRAIRTPSPPLRSSSPLAHLFSASASLPSPSDLFTSCLAKESTPPLAAASMATEDGVWATLDEPTETPAHVPTLTKHMKPIAHRKKKAADEAPAAKIKRRVTTRKKAERPADDDAGIRSRYFVQQTKAGKSSVAKEAAVRGKPPLKTLSPRPPAPAPRLDWTPVKDTVKTIDLCSSSPEIIASFSERLEQLKCSRKSSSADTEKVEPMQSAITTKRSLDMIGLPNAHRLPVKGARKPRKKDPATPHESFIMEYFPAASNPGIRKPKDIMRPKKKRRSNEGAPTLLSPISAQARFTEQQFIFGTSSQLENESLQLTGEGSCVSLATRTAAGKSLEASNSAIYERKAPGTGLWDEGKHIDPELLNQVDAQVQWIESASQLTPAPGPGTGSPPATADSPASPINECAPGLPFKHSQATSQQSSSASGKGTRREGSALLETVTAALELIQQEQKASPMPNYSTFTTAQLQYLISKYGIKKMTSRVTMIEHLEACWRALNPSAPPEPFRQVEPQPAQPPGKRVSSSAPRGKRVINEPLKLKLITQAVRLAAEHPNPSSSFYHRMLMYDPIILEDLTEWLNKEGLNAVGADEDADVKIADVKLWCDANSVCGLPRETQKGLERKRF